MDRNVRKMPAQRPWQLEGQVLEGALMGRRDDGGGPVAGARLAGVLWGRARCALVPGTWGL